MGMPTKWFFEDHRIPYQLRMIEERGRCYLPSFFYIVLKRWIPNYDDYLRYYEKYGSF